MCSLLVFATQSVYVPKINFKLFLKQKFFFVVLKFRIFKMYKVSRLCDTITETWYFVYLNAYKVSHRHDSITQTWFGPNWLNRAGGLICFNHCLISGLLHYCTKKFGKQFLGPQFHWVNDDISELQLSGHPWFVRNYFNPILKGSHHQDLFWYISCKICSWTQCTLSRG